MLQLRTAYILLCLCLVATLASEKQETSSSTKQEKSVEATDSNAPETEASKGKNATATDEHRNDE